MKMDVQEWVGIGVTQEPYGHGLIRFVFCDSKGQLKLASMWVAPSFIVSTLSVDDIYFIPKGI